MKLAFYTGTRKGWRGLGSFLTRFRLRSNISHCELVFECGDGVDDLMPDGMAHDASPWCASATAVEKLPDWSAWRAGRRGGVRFKRIDIAADDWLVVDVPDGDAHHAAQWMRNAEGARYDWRGIFGFIAWPIGHKSSRYTCHEACAAALGFPEPDRLNPALLHAVQQYANKPHQGAFFMGVRNG